MTNVKKEKFLEQFCADKKAAYNAGIVGTDYDRWYCERGLLYKEYNSGHIAEIAMLYLLGAFSTCYNGYFKVACNKKMDGRDIDYEIFVGMKSIKIQQKFAHKDTWTHKDNIKVIEVGADKSFTGVSNISSMAGNIALYTVLCESGTCTEDEFYDVMDENPWLDSMAIKVWRSIRG